MYNIVGGFEKGGIGGGLEDVGAFPSYFVGPWGRGIGGGDGRPGRLAGAAVETLAPLAKLEGFRKYIASRNSE